MKWPESWKVVCGAASTMSLINGSSECRSAGPLMAAMSGWGEREKGRLLAGSKVRMGAAPSPRSTLRWFISFRSAPALKARPVPVRMPARISGSALKSARASCRSSIIVPPRALRRSGRFMVNTANWSRLS